MFTNIYLNVDEYWLTSFIPQQRFKCHNLLNYSAIPENVISEDYLSLLITAHIGIMWILPKNLSINLLY